MVTLLLVGLTFVLIYLVLHSRKSTFPGPKRIPLLGSLPFLSVKRGIADSTLAPEVTKHKISLVQIGPVDLYIINDYNIAKELFSLDIFCHHKAMAFTQTHRFIEPDQPVGIICNTGEGWSTQRRFSLKTLRDFGFGKKTLEDSINTEIDDIIERYASSRGDVLIESEFNRPMINILWQIVAGRRITPDDKEACEMVDTVNDLFIKGYMKYTMLPFIIFKYFPKFLGYDRIAYIYSSQRDFFLKTIDEHEASYDPHHMRDFIDVYLRQMKSDDSGKYTKADLCIILMDFFHAGTETSSTTMKWVILYLTTYQEYQEQCRDEIRSVIGDSRVQVDQKANLPFTHAFITEVQRMSCVAPMSLPHFTTQDYTYQGHTFPKGATVHANIGFIMKDPNNFKNPHVFNPSRFIDESGGFIKDDRVVPFSLGKRFCMGESLARSELFLFTANLIQKLRFEPPEDHPCPDPQNYTVNFTTIPHHFYVKISPV